jgi:UDP-N-acetylglucosamine 2-epimerase (non-hydrolysing)
MPEEINRILTDAVSDLLFTTEPSGNENLVREGIEKEKIAFVGNVMIDTLLRFHKRAKQSDVLGRLGIVPHAYALLTLHRPSSVDDFDRFRGILRALAEVSRSIPLIFPCHPRTWKQIQLLKLEVFFRSPDGIGSRIVVTQPLGYLDCLCLMSHARFVLTDSGGIQEETTVLGTPCLTLRENTERPVTVSHGTNTLVGYSEDRIISEVSKILAGDGKKGCIPELWDGQAAARIVEVMLRNA